MRSQACARDRRLLSLASDNIGYAVHDLLEDVFAHREEEGRFEWDDVLTSISKLLSQASHRVRTRGLRVLRQLLTGNTAVPLCLHLAAPANTPTLLKLEEALIKATKDEDTPLWTTHHLVHKVLTIQKLLAPIPREVDTQEHRRMCEEACGSKRQRE